MAMSGGNSVTSNIRPFDGTSFENWRFRVELLLERNGVLNMLTDDAPSDDGLKKTFAKNDAKARDLVVQCVSDSILELIKTKTTAKEMMATLQTTYVRKGLTSRISLQKKLRNMCFDGSGSLNNYVIEFDKVVSELKSVGGSIDSQEYVSQLLASMPDEYQSVVTSIDILLTSNPEIVTEEFVKSKILAEEERIKRCDSNGINPGNAFIGQKKFFQKKRMNRSGHDGIAKQRNEGQSKDNISGANSYSFSKIKCWYCNTVGHKRSQCPKRTSMQANVASDNPHGVHGAAKKEEEDNVAFMSAVHSHLDMKWRDTTPYSSICFDTEFAGNTICSDEILMVIDSGASNHLIKLDYKHCLTNVKNVSHVINVAKEGESVTAKFSGDLPVMTVDNVPVSLFNVLSCESLYHNLLSVRKMVASGLDVIFSNDTVKVLKGNRVVLQGNRVGNLFVVKFRIRHTYDACLVNNSSEIWHRRMGHSSEFPVVGVCEICLRGKQSNKNFLKSLPEDVKPTRILECISSDVCGKINPPTHNGYQYFVSFIDNYSHFGIIYLMKNKSDVGDCLQKYVAMVEARFNSKVSKIRCDNGGEYRSAKVREFCSQKGIELIYTVPHTPQQNGIAERYNQTIMNKARCLIFDSHFGKEMWGEAVLAAAYLTNRTPTSVLPNRMTPFDRWYGHKPDLKKIHVFGCVAHALVPREDRSGKLAPRSRKLFLIGYGNNGYRLWDPDGRIVVIARSVVFEEHVSHGTPAMTHEDADESMSIVTELDSDIVPITGTQDLEGSFKSATGRQSVESNDLQTGQQDLPLIDLTSGDTPEPIRVSSRGRVIKPRKFPEFETYLVAKDVCPSTYKEAMKSPDAAKWMDAMKTEYNAMMKNEVWTLIDQPQDLLGKAKKKILKQESFSSSFSESPRYLTSDFEFVYDPQEIGVTNSHMALFTKVREDRLQRLAVPTNQLIIRLEKLLAKMPSDPQKRKAHEQNIVPWIDGTAVTRCPNCAGSFHLARRQHHCRLCGSVMCSNCSHFMAISTALRILDKPVKEEVNADGTQQSSEPEQLRLCIHCIALLEVREEKRVNQRSKPIISQFYERLADYRAQAAKLNEEYLKMAFSLNSGETTYSLKEAQMAKVKLLRLSENIDSLSSKIAVLGTDSDNPPQGQALRLQNMVRSACTMYLREQALNLPNIPNEEELEGIQQRRRERITARIHEEKMRRHAKMNQSSSQKPNTSPNKSQNMIDQLSLGQSWVPETNKKANESEDPLIEQMNIIRVYIKEAKLANKTDEVTSLEENLQELKKEFYRKQASHEDFTSRSGESSEGASLSSYDGGKTASESINSL